MNAVLVLLTLLALPWDVTKEDLKKLVAAGISDDVIVAFIGSHRPVSALSPGDLVELRSAKVSEKVLSAMLEATKPPAEPNPRASARATEPPVTYSYGGWSGFKPGSWVKVQIQGQLAGGLFDLEQTHTLLDVTSEKAVIARKGRMRIGGQEFPADKERDEVWLKDDPTVTLQREGDEEIDVAGKKLRCHFIEGLHPRTNAQVKFWISPEIPGGVAKGEIRTVGTTAVKSVTVLSWGVK